MRLPPLRDCGHQTSLTPDNHLIVHFEIDDDQPPVAHIGVNVLSSHRKRVLNWVYLDALNCHARRCACVINRVYEHADVAPVIPGVSISIDFWSGFAASASATARPSSSRSGIRVLNRRLAFWRHRHSPHGAIRWPRIVPGQDQHAPIIAPPFFDVTVIALEAFRTFQAATIVDREADVRPSATHMKVGWRVLVSLDLN